MRSPWRTLLFLAVLARTSCHVQPSFTFASNNSFLQLDPAWPLDSYREVSFQFRTELPHGLLMYHGLADTEPGSPHYELYLILENAQLKIIHVFMQDGSGETFYIGKGLNRNKWHRFKLMIDPSTAEMAISVDSTQILVTLSSLSDHPNYGELAKSPHSSRIYFGGVDPGRPQQQYNYVRFVGCLGGVQFGAGGRPLLDVPVVARGGVEDGCRDRCSDSHRCLHGGTCLNHYTHSTCDCFGTGFEGDICSRSNMTTVTLRGYSYFSYRLFYWKDRIHSETNRIAMFFKTYVADSVLLYGAGLHPIHNYIALSIKGGVLYFEMDFGDGPINATLGSSLHNHVWHNLTVIHRGKRVEVALDRRHRVFLEAPGPHHHLHLDPEVYIGAAPPNALAVRTHKKFVGCLKSVYFNRANLLLGKTGAGLMYHSVFPVEWGCSTVGRIPLTFSTVQSRLELSRPRQLQLVLEFRTELRECVLASGRTSGPGYWEIHLRRSEAFFSLVDDKGNSVWQVKEGKRLSDDRWHAINVTFSHGHASILIDGRQMSRGHYGTPVELVGPLVVGSSLRNQSQGFVGCLRDIFVGGEWLDPRSVVGTARGRVSLDNCQLVDPCQNPQVCENGGRCSLDRGEPSCDCSGTGYTGKTCHFSIYKRTCEELYLVGYRTSGVYKIDIDRNGPFPPANVYCEMKGEGGAITTSVENNLPHEMVIRKPGMEGFYVNVTYRDFSPAMLQHLIQHSKHCSQHIKYECFKTLLGLRSYTWFQAASGRYVTNVGSLPSGRCECALSAEGCAMPHKFCNCDSADEWWRLDEGVYTAPEELAIIQAYILQPPGLSEDAEARLSLGALRCIEADTQQYVITFKTSGSYVEVPGWYSGDMQFSFRTSNSKAVLIYQAAVHSAQRYLRVLLTSDYTLSFEFAVTGKPPQKVTLRSQRRLNSGEWQQVWVDHDTHHMRFTVNLDSEKIDLGEDEEVGPFEGPLYVGGVPKQHAGDSTIKEGFIGCFRGLVINNVVIELYNHLTGRTAAIVQGCRPSCAPDPCQNGATCLEYWGSYECRCANSIAHSGTNCEHNVNENGVTFLTEQAYLHFTRDGEERLPVLGYDFQLSFRTYATEGALLLYATDHVNNVVQLHVEPGGEVVLTFNSNSTLLQARVAPQGVTRGLPVQVKVMRTEYHTILQVDNMTNIVKVPLAFLDHYRQQPWTEGQELEVVRPPRGTYQTLPHSEMFLGGVGSGTISQIPGLVGCLQGLKIRETILDLEAAANANPSDEVRGSCTMMCDERPCQHQGVCVEDWRNNHTTCDCALTSYTGEYCHKEVGGSFDGSSLVQYYFADHPSTRDTVAVRLAFSTEGLSDLRQVLFLLEINQSTRYILFALTPEGFLLIEEERENNEVLRKMIKKASGSFADSRRHWIYYSRHQDAASVVVDGETHLPTAQSLGPGTSTHNASVTVVGGVPENHRRLQGDYANFRGCISNVIIDLGTVHMLPLETAFGYQKGSLEKVKVTGAVNEKKCAQFDTQSEEETATVIIPPEILGSKWEQEPLQQAPYKKVFVHEEAQALQRHVATTTKVAIGMGVFIAVIMLFLAIYVWRISRRHKHRRLREEFYFYRDQRRNTPNHKVTFKIGPEANHRSPEVQPLTTLADFAPALPAIEEEERPEDSEEPAGVGPPPYSDPTAEISSPVLEESDEDLFDPEDGLRSRAPLASTSEVTINRLSQTFN